MSYTRILINHKKCITNALRTLFYRKLDQTLDRVPFQKL